MHERKEVPSQECKVWTYVENETRRVAHASAIMQATLLTIESGDRFPFSTKKENEDVHNAGELNSKLYHEILEDYRHAPIGVQRQKIDYWKRGDVNIGHKVHLETPVASVISVSNFLKTEGLVHKYIADGNQRGKKFTVYLGSYDNAIEQSGVISRALEEHLRRPRAVDEIEYAPNVVGRFCAETTNDLLRRWRSSAWFGVK